MVVGSEFVLGTQRLVRARASENEINDVLSFVTYAAVVVAVVWVALAEVCCVLAVDCVTCEVDLAVEAVLET